MKKKLGVMGLILLLLVTAAGCGTKETQSAALAEETPDREFRWGLLSDIASLDPIYGYDPRTNAVINNITEGLLYFDADNQLQPMLAASWETVDATTYVYEIRPDVNFSDGSPMTMEDVLRGRQRERMVPPGLDVCQCGEHGADRRLGTDGTFKPAGCPVALYLRHHRRPHHQQGLL